MTKNDEKLLGTLFAVLTTCMVVIGLSIALCKMGTSTQAPAVLGIHTCNGEVVLHDHERATFIAAHDGCLYMESPPEHVDYSPALVGR